MPQDEPSFQEILQFDPFDQQDSAEAAPEGGAPSGEEKPTEPPAPEVAEPAPAGEAPPVSEPPKQVSQADLESLIRQQTATIAAAMQRPQAPAAPAAPAAAKFQLGVPDALVNALRSEDPKEFSAGVGAMINGVANHVWNAFAEHLEKNVLPSVPRMIENYVQSAQRQQEVAVDFYGAYPALRIPELAPVIQNIGAQIAREWYEAGRDLNWSAPLRDAIAQRVFERMPFLRQDGNGVAPPARRQPFATGGGARPAAEPDGPQRDMMEMIFGGR